MDKTLDSIHDAVSIVSDDDTVMIGGFGGSGAPIELIHALIDRFVESGSPKDLTVINNNAGNGNIGIAAMLSLGMVKKAICSYPRTTQSHSFAEKYLAGEVQLELVPQGTLAERIRAGGAGIPAFYTPAGYGTELAHGKEVKEFDGKHYVLERWLKADIALVKAELGDAHGNLIYRLASRNFNPLMCMAANVSIAQVEKIQAVGNLAPEHIQTPGIFVNTVVEVTGAQQEEDLIRASAKYPTEKHHA